MSSNLTTTGTQADDQLAFSVSDLIRILSISRATAYTLIHSDGFPTLKVGSRILIPRAGLERWLAEQSGEVRHGA